MFESFDKMKKPSALLASDLHIREDNPICRKDELINTLILKLKFAKNICEKYNIPFLVAGDIFHRWKNSPNLLTLTIQNIPKMICIPGQHDLKFHQTNLYSQSSLAVLQAAKKAIVILKPGEIIDPSDHWPDQNNWLIVGFPFGTEVKSIRLRKGNSKKIICMIHDLVIKSKNPFPGAKVKVGHRLLKKFKYDLIVSGDNHQAFTDHHKDKLLINCGSISRQSSDQINHKPKFYLWYAKDNSYKEIEIPIENNVIDISHVKKEKEKNDRIDDYIDAMSSDYEKKLNFDTNIENHIRQNEVHKQTENFIWKWIEK